MGKKSHAVLMRAVERHALSGRGKTSSSQRIAAERHAAGFGGPTPSDGTGLDPVLKEFVEKVALSPSDVEDADIDRLRAEGLSEDQIFELTVVSAMGVGRSRLERGLEALRETTE